MTYKIETISLSKYSIYIVLSILVASFCSFIITSFFKEDYKLFISLNFLFSFLLLELSKKNYVKKIEISLDEEHFTLILGTTHQKISLENIEKYTYNYLFKTYPSFKLILKNKKTIKFNSKNKASQDLDDLIMKLQTLRLSS